MESAKSDAERHGPEMPAVIRRLCSKPSIIAGEDPTAYAQLMDLISAEIEPTNVVEWLLTKDIADAEWELMRLNGFKVGMINQRMRWSLQKHIEQITSEKNRPSAQRLMHGLVNGDKEAQQQIESKRPSAPTASMVDFCFGSGVRRRVFWPSAQLPKPRASARRCVKQAID